MSAEPDTATYDQPDNEGDEMNVTEQGIKHSVTVTFEPRAAGQYQGVPMMAHSLIVNWRWENGAWEQVYPKVLYYRMKKDGTRYSDVQERTLFDSEKFTDVIVATRPQYVPMLVTAGS